MMPGHHRPGQLGRDRAQRRARGGARRPAHHTRRAQRPAGAGQRAGRARHRPARPGGGILFAAQRRRRPRRAGARAEDLGVRPHDALSAGARRVGRAAQPGGTLSLASDHPLGVNRSTPAILTFSPVSFGWLTPSSTVTSRKSNGLTPARQATLRPYWFWFEA